MKYISIAVIALAALSYYVFRVDPVEGASMRIVAVLVGAAGVFTYFEGLKREIIVALRDKANSGSR